MNKAQAEYLVQKIRSAKDVLLTTHKFGDGDGLGAMMACYHGLKKIKKNVRAITVDKVASKYDFLFIKKYTENFETLKTPIQKSQLALVFDTNDSRLVEPLYQELKQKCDEIIFIDHHLPLVKGPQPTLGSLIDTKASSTGEIVYFILKNLEVEFDDLIATSLYASILFDTQRFKFIKDSPASYRICADLQRYMTNSDHVYNQLFCFASKEKLYLFSKAINRIKFFNKDEIAILEMTVEEFINNQLDTVASCDFIDRINEINSVQIAVLILKLSDGNYKLSFRSKERNVAKLAECFGGGGHNSSSGATLTNYQKDIKAEVLKSINEL